MPGFYATITRYYEAENNDKTDDLAFYAELAEEYGAPILDVGCGTGRVVLHLAAAGYQTHGIDNEPAMLARAISHLEDQADLRGTLHLYEGDILTFNFQQQFKLILMTYNALMHFHDQETQIVLLKRLRGLLAPDGLLVFDLPNAGEAFASQDSDYLTLERTFIEPETGHLVMQQSTSILDRVEQLMRVTWIYDEIEGDGAVKRTYAPVVLRYFFYTELELLLKLTGFEVDAVYGGMDGSPFEDGCERMIVLAK